MDTYTAPVKYNLETDVLVVGSGAAGATAAIAAARQGASVLLVERYGFMGGTSTMALDTFCGFYVYGGAPEKIVGGIADDVLDLLQKHDRILIRASTNWRSGDVITYNPHSLKVVWETLALRAGVKLLYHTLVVDALMDGDRLRGVIAVNKGGLLRINAQVVVDASGDADVAAVAGVPYESGGSGGMLQGLTTTFRLGNVDVERAQQTGHEALQGLMREAADSGEYRLTHRGGTLNLTPLPREMAANMARVRVVDATDVFQLTAAEIEGRQQALEYVRFLKEQIPGYENAYLANLSTQIGIRESRRIFGEYRLTRDDVLNARQFEDSIARCGWPVEDHTVKDTVRFEYLQAGMTYDIPFRCLLPLAVDGLLVAGRCLSADHDAHASARVMAQCMAMGQAAGTAAAMCIQNRVAPRAVAIPALRDRLRSDGALISGP
jgi:ribulose 1,5-bisphosphate synthetase/thiazole synthase